MTPEELEVMSELRKAAVRLMHVAHLPPSNPKHSRAADRVYHWQLKAWRIVRTTE